MNIISTVILFPVYIWIVFSLLHKKVPNYSDTGSWNCDLSLGSHEFTHH